jgi:actin, other eukaryote
MSKKSIVFDNGSGIFKAGFSEEELPKIIFPTIVGKNNEKEYYIGYNTTKDLSKSYPIQKGIITNWEEMENIWNHTFKNELKVESNENPLLLTEVPFNPKPNREKMTEIFFETFSIPLMYLSQQSTLSLFAGGLTTGLGVNLGYGVTHTVPVYEGFELKNQISSLDFAGKEITELMKNLLKEKGNEVETEIVNEIKEKHSHVKPNNTKDELLNEKEYELPDGKKICLGDELYKSTEILFQPNIIGKGEFGIQDKIIDSIEGCSEEIRKELYGNISLSGGTSMSQGIENRLLNELKLKNESIEFKIHSNLNRNYSSWIGGALLASSIYISGSSLWLSIEEYNDYGYELVNKKFF